MIELDHSKVLVIPDVHQDINWVEHILSKWESKVDHIIWLGDWFDTFDPKPAYGAGATAEWLKERMESTNDTFIIGNHDMVYMEAIMIGRNYNYICSGATKSKCEKIKKYLTKKEWSRFEPFAILNRLNDKFVFSHAGIAESLLPYVPDNDYSKSLSKLYDMAKEHMTDKIYEYSPIFGAGKSRGGNENVGGIIWSDFNFDHVPFKDGNYKQIVGHTGYMNTIRYIDDDLCIDGNQSTWAIINDDEIQFESIVEPLNIEKITI